MTSYFITSCTLQCLQSLQINAPSDDRGKVVRRSSVWIIFLPNIPRRLSRLQRNALTGSPSSLLILSLLVFMHWFLSASFCFRLVFLFVTDYPYTPWKCFDLSDQYKSLNYRSPKNDRFPKTHLRHTLWHHYIIHLTEFTSHSTWWHITSAYSK